jgi:hypothetical protein
MPTRERRSDSRRATRERDTKKDGRKSMRDDEAQDNSLSKLVSRKEASSGRKHNKSEKGTTTNGREEKVPTEGFKTSSILNTHPVNARTKRPYDGNARTDPGRA